MDTPRERYQKDNHFKVLVDTMVAHIHHCNFSPSEMREAAILASIIYEEHNFSRIRYVSLDVEKAFKVLHNWHETPNKPLHVDRESAAASDE